MGPRRGRRSPRKVFLVQRDDDGLDGVADRLQERLDGGAHESLKALKTKDESAIRAQRTFDGDMNPESGTSREEARTSAAAAGHAPNPGIICGGGGKEAEDKNISGVFVEDRGVTLATACCSR